jgi:hypothetical protein
MRGPQMSQYCEWRLPRNRTFRAWRILYLVDSRSVPTLVTVGEHYLPLTTNARSRTRSTANRLGQTLRLADPYQALGKELGLSPSEMATIAKALKGRQHHCC